MTAAKFAETFSSCETTEGFFAEALAGLFVHFICQLFVCSQSYFHGNKAINFVPEYLSVSFMVLRSVIFHEGNEGTNCKYCL